MVGLPPVFGAPLAPLEPAFVKDWPRTALLGQDWFRVTHAEPFG